MLINTPEIHLMQDTGNQAWVKVTGYYTSANTTTNVKILQANTLYGANTSVTPCELSLIYASWVCNFPSNGVIAIEYQSTVNTNTAILNFGGIGGGGEFAPIYIRNNANTPSGDINMFINGITSGSSFTFILGFQKEKGSPGKATARAWANTEAGY